MVRGAARCVLCVDNQPVSGSKMTVLATGAAAGSAINCRQQQTQLAVAANIRQYSIST